jgi:4-hydroxy-4-methyl-2-oxoglutarate aldolase
MPDNPRLGAAELLELARWNTPTVYNGWEQITRHNPGRDGFNVEPVTDFMPGMGAVCAVAITLVVQPGEPAHAKANPDAWLEYWSYVASVPGPKIVVTQDLDKPSTWGSAWGEVNASIHKALGCVGAIVDGGVRDLSEMESIGFKALARRTCVGHAHAVPVRWGCPVEVFGRSIEPGNLIHADKHGFLVVPEEDEAQLLDAARFMDTNECNTYLAAVRSGTPRDPQAIVAELADARARFRTAARERFQRAGEW